MSDPDIRLKRLAVIICRDATWAKMSHLAELVRDALLYAGAPLDYAQESIAYDWGNPVKLTALFAYLSETDVLAEFLTQMLRSYRPIIPGPFVDHLEPLGFDWERKSNQIRPASTRPEAERRIRTELDSLLIAIDNAFPNMLQGAWEAYYSDNPDRFRHSISSCRELLNQVTRKLTGDEKLERKERVRRILGSKHRTHLVESAADFIDAIYGAQSAEEHTTPDQATALFVMVETEHILHFLLKHASKKTD